MVRAELGVREPSFGVLWCSNWVGQEGAGDEGWARAFG